LKNIPSTCRDDEAVSVMNVDCSILCQDC